MKKNHYGRPLPTNRRELNKFFSPKHVNLDTFEIVAGRGNLPLAKEVGKLIGKEVYQPCSNFADGEIDVQIQPNVRGREVFVIESMYPSPNDRIQELVLMADAATRADGKKITALIPYFAYARQDRKPKSRTPISAARVANQIASAGADRIFTIDIHAEQSEGSVNIVWDNVYGDKVIVPRIKKLGLKDAVVLSPDVGSAKRSEKFLGRLQNGNELALVYKKRNLYKHDESEAIAIMGDVKGRSVIIFDDLISTGSTALNAAKLAKKNGATKVIVAASHALFVPDSSGKTLPDRLHEPNCPIDKVIITDTIFQNDEIRKNKKIEVVSAAPILAVAIYCYLTSDSIAKRLID